MEPVALIFLTLVAGTTIGWLLLTFREALTDIARALGLDYVKPAIRRLIEPPRVNPQSYAANQSQTDPVQASEPRFKPMELTPQELVQLLSVVTLVRGDERGAVSQEGASRAAGISKVTAAAIMAEMRGESPKSVADARYQFEPVNGNPNVTRRTGVKPIR